MLNQDKDIVSLQTNDLQPEKEKLIENGSKISSYSIIKKYSLVTILFISGLIFVSIVKNESRNLEREINILKAENNKIKSNLKQANLDNEVITSPQNISRLAKEYLNINLVSYKKSQILPLKKLSNQDENLVTTTLQKKENLPSQLKLKIAKKVEEKKMEIQKLQKLYSNPKLIPSEIKAKVALTIAEKKKQLENIHDSPKDLVTLKRAGQWSAVQIVKLFLGIPTIPGR